MADDQDNVVEVRHLTKRYGGKSALEDLSFDVKRGEILGLLGPNGAGKTTTMRILTSYLAPSAGKVHINGYSTATDSMDVRRQIGYMPESVPLYPEMRVREYLAYRGSLKGLTRARNRGRLAEVMAQCALEDVHRQVIGSLSRGYQQRVGLADALLNEPPLLILDEPSIGMDPNQIREVRELIRGLAGKHTVIFSSHILSEIELVASRVLILHKGRLVASDSTLQLKQSGQLSFQVRLELKGNTEQILPLFMAMDTVIHVEMKSLPDGWARLDVETHGPADIRADLFRLCAQHNWPVREIRKLSSSLEEIFIRLTSGSTLS
jgi:ABC-2 type transport system ATP-binding protein